MTAWFVPEEGNYFSRVGRKTIIADMIEAKGTLAKRSWNTLKKPDLAAIAEREVWPIRTGLRCH